MWGYGHLLVMSVVLREGLFGQYATPDPLIYFAAYSGYIIIPMLMMFRVAWTPIFKPKTHQD